MATSRACQVGDCSCWWASSCSSSTTTHARSPTGAHAAARVPTTVAPAAPRAQSTGWAATATPARRSRSVIVAAIAADGHSTSALPSAAPASATCTRLVAGGSRSTDRGAANAPARRAWSGGADRPARCRRRGAAARPARATRSSAATRGDRPSATPPTRPARSAQAVGPEPARLASGRSATPSGGSTPTATIHPPTRRPWSSMRTTSPTRTWSRSASGTR